MLTVLAEPSRMPHPCGQAKAQRGQQPLQYRVGRCERALRAGCQGDGLGRDRGKAACTNEQRGEVLRRTHRKRHRSGRCQCCAQQWPLHAQQKLPLTMAERAADPAITWIEPQAGRAQRNQRIWDGAQAVCQPHAGPGRIEIPAQQHGMYARHPDHRRQHQRLVNDPA